MRKVLATAVAVAVAGLLGMTAPASATTQGPDHGTLSHATTLTTFEPGDYGAFAESMAPDGRGNVVVSVTQWGETDNTGQLWLVRRDGSKSPFGPAIPLGGCAMLLGVAVDHGRVFVGARNYYSDELAEYCPTQGPASGVLRVTPSGVSRVMTLPQGSWPNGLAIADGMFYVSDSAGYDVGGERVGAVWRASSWRVTAPMTPWFTSTRLAPSPDGYGIGADGITVRCGSVYVTSYDQGLVLKVDIGRNGAPGRARVLAADPALVTADGVTFDAVGRLWVTTNAGGPQDSGRLALITSSSVVTVTTPEGALDYPTQPLIDPRGRVLVLNGSFNSGMPSLVALTR